MNMGRSERNIENFQFHNLVLVALLFQLRYFEDNIKLKFFIWDEREHESTVALSVSADVRPTCTPASL